MPRTVVVACLLSGCMATRPVPPDVAISVGRPAGGILRGGRQLAPRGDGYVFVRSRKASYGASALLGLLSRATSRLHRERPGPPIRIGDLSLANGGHFAGHNSHRSGRDVDIVFPMADVSGTPLRGIGGIPIELSGFGIRERKLFRLDVVRTWGLVRAMLLDPETEIQWVFVSRGVKSVLLEHALRTGEDRALVARAAWILHQPSRGRTHSDHIHLRVYCSGVDRAYGCVDGPPIWPWRKKRHDGGGATQATDGALVAALLEHRTGEGAQTAHAEPAR